MLLLFRKKWYDRQTAHYDQDSTAERGKDIQTDTQTDKQMSTKDFEQEPSIQDTHKKKHQPKLKAGNSHGEKEERLTIKSQP